MELVYDILPWVLVVGAILAVVYVIIAIALGRYFYKEFKRRKEHHAIHAKKMAEMKKEFEEQWNRKKDKMNRFK